MRFLTTSSALFAGAMFTVQMHATEGPAFCCCSDAKPDSRNVVHPTAEETSPLPEGSPIPELEHLRNPEGETVELADLANDGSLVLVFYRGGWCPFCNVHLGELAQAQPQLKEAGVSVVGVSPDSPETLAAYGEEHDLPYLLLSDNRHEAMKAFGIAFAVDAETNEMLIGHGMDLSAASGNPELVLPVPSVFVINTEGIVTFAHANPDYRERLSGEEVLEAADVPLNE